MTNAKLCRRCGRGFPLGGPGGQCPFCLLELGRQRSLAGEQNGEQNGEHNGEALAHDQNLLFGILALQLRLVRTNAFVEAAAAWAANPAVSVGERMVRSSALSTEDRELLDQLVSQTIEENRGDLLSAIEQWQGDEVFSACLTPFSTAADSETHTDEGQDVQNADGQNVDGQNADGQKAGGQNAADRDRTSPDGNNHDAAGKNATDHHAEAADGEPASDIELVRESPGRYIHRREYSRGGMGRILLVHDQFLERDVALKELLPYSISDDGEHLGFSPTTATAHITARFLREARVTGQLEHPSVVPVYEMGRRADGTLYYTMKLVRGRTLAESLQAAKSEAERLSFLSHYLDLCHALAYAHARNIVHRDVKPSNVMIGEFGETVVIDWGLAKVLGRNDEDEEEIAKTWSNLQDRLSDEANQTVDGARIGTPQYMAPEQVEGRVSDIDQRSDVFALGVVLYQILTGEMPFTGRTSREIFAHIVGADPEPILESAANVPPELVSICYRAMRKSKSQRYQSAKELADEIQRFLTGSVVQAYNYSHWELARNVYRRHRAVWNTAAVATAGLLLIGCISYWNIYRSRNAAIQARDREVVAREAEVNARTQAERERERSGSANYVNQIRLAQSLLREHDYRRVRDILWETEPRRRRWEWGHLLNRAYGEIYSFTGDAGVAVSNDGTRIASYHTNSNVMNIRDAANGEITKQLSWELPAHIEVVRFSPDDRELVAQFSNRDLRLWNVDDWQALPVPDPGQTTAGSINYLPNGQVMMTDGERVRIWDRYLQQELVTLVAKSAVHTAVASSDSGRVMGVLGNGDVQVWDSHTGDSIGLLAGDASGQAVFSPTGKQVASNRGNHVEIWDVDSQSIVHRLDSEHASVTWMAFNPSGTRLLVTGSEGKVVVWDTRAGTPTHEFRDPVGITRSCWGADESLVYSMRFGGAVSVWELQSDGAKLINRLEHADPVTELHPIPGTDRIATRNFDRTVTVSHARTDFSSEILAGSRDDLGAFSVDHDGDRVAVSNADGILSVIDIEHQQNLMNVALVGTPPSQPVLNDITHHGQFVAAKLDLFLPMVFDSATGELVASHDGHDSYVVALATSADSRLAATADWNGSIHVWELETGVLQQRFTLDQQPTVLTFLPDGLGVVAGYRNGQVSGFDLATDSESFRIDSTGSAVTALCWSDDSQQLAIGYDNGETIVWCPEGDRQTLVGQSSQVHSLAFVSDGTQLLSGSSRGFRIWDFDQTSEILSLTEPLQEFVQAERISGTEQILLRDARSLRRWRRVPLSLIGTSEQQQAGFDRYRRQAIANASDPIPIDRHDQVMVFGSQSSIVDCLRGLDEAIQNAQDSPVDEPPSDQPPSDELADELPANEGAANDEILADQALEEGGSAGDPSRGLRIGDLHINAVAPLGIAPGDRLTHIANRPVVDGASARSALAAALQNVDDWAQELTFTVIRGNTTQRLLVRILQTKSETIDVSIERGQAVALLSRLDRSLRLHQSDDPSPGYQFPPVGIESDRISYRKSLVGPFDQITKVNDRPVPDSRSLRKVLGQLRVALESGERSSYVINVRRGSFREVRIRYEVL